VKDSGTSIQSGFFAVDIDGSGGGGDAYRTAIEKWTCDPAAIDVYVGDVLPVLKGDLHGPTIQGVLDLISQDPIAWWDDPPGRFSAATRMSRRRAGLTVRALLPLSRLTPRNSNSNKRAAPPVRSV